MQLTYMVVNKGNFAHTHNEKSKDSLYVRKHSGKNVTIVIQQNKLIGVKTQEEQRSRSTKIKDEQIGRTTIIDFALFK